MTEPIERRGRPRKDFDQIIEDFEWMLAGGTPVDEACTRLGYQLPASVMRIYQRHNLPTPLALQRECEYLKGQTRNGNHH